MTALKTEWSPIFFSFVKMWRSLYLRRFFWGVYSLQNSIFNGKLSRFSCQILFLPWRNLCFFVAQVCPNSFLLPNRVLVFPLSRFPGCSCVSQFWTPLAVTHVPKNLLAGCGQMFCSLVDNRTLWMASSPRFHSQRIVRLSASRRKRVIPRRPQLFTSRRSANND